MRITRISTAFALSVLILTACRTDETNKEGDKDKDTVVGDAERKDDGYLGTAREAQQPGAQPGTQQPGVVPNDQTMNQQVGRETPPQAEAVQLSDEMRVLIGQLDQGEAAAVAVLKQYGSSEEIGSNELGTVRLTNYRVVARDGDCYTVEAMEGAITRVYSICWAEGKINEIERQPDKQQQPGA